MNASRQPLVRAVAILLSHEPERHRLDEAATARLVEAEQALLNLPPRLLLEALNAWNKGGRPAIGH